MALPAGTISAAVPAPVAPGNGRACLLVFPREHGAWGILLVPLVVGAWLGYQPGRLGALLLFTVAVLALFLLRTPLEAWLGGGPVRARTPAERSLARRAAAAYAAVALLAAGPLLRQTPPAGLLLVGAAAALCGVLQAGLRRLRRETRLLSQVVGAVGLTATAPGAYYVASGALDATAGVLWLVNWLFAAHQVHYVHLRIAAARVSSRAEKLRHGAGFFQAQVAMLLAVVALSTTAYAPPALPLAFLPGMVRAGLWFLRPPASLAVHWLGVGELAQGLLFGAVLIMVL